MARSIAVASTWTLTRSTSYADSEGGTGWSR